MRLLKGVLVVAALALAAPAWAHGGHGNHNGWDKHRHGAHWRDHRYYGHQHHHPRYYYSQYYYPPYPVYAAPAPGVHIVVPNIYIPLR